MSNQDHVKYRKLKTTSAEAILKRKHDETVELGRQMNKKNETEEQIEKRLAEQRRKTRMQALRDQRNQQQEESERTGNSVDGRSGQGITGASNIHNNINVSINYTVNQTTDISTISRRKNSTKKGKKGPTPQQRQKDLMNTSLSRMLDEELLASNSEQNVDKTKNLSNNVTDSMTQKQFHGDKIYLQGGAMAFRPLGMETVLESNDEQHDSLNPQAWKNKLKTQASRQKQLAPQTTEQNIALQQHLDFASAEEFITFGRFSQLGLQVQEDQKLGPTLNPGENAYSSSMNVPGGLKSMSQQRSIPTSKSVPKKVPGIDKTQAGLTPVRSKSNLKTNNNVTPLKRIVPEDSRQVHSGLLQMEQRLQARTVAQSTPAANFYEDRSNFSSAFNRQPEAQQYGTLSQNSQQQYVQFNESAINSIVANQRSGSQKITGASTAQRTPQVKKSPQPVHPKLHRQKTGVTKEIKRQMRNQNEDTSEFEEDVEEEVKADTVLAEQPLPAMPHRMRSNLTFQPQSNKIAPDIAVDNAEKEIVQDDNISQLAIDYGMHQQNKKRIANLMALLGNKGPGAIAHIEDLDINIGDSMSNIDAVSQQTKSKQSKMASVSQRIQEIISNEHGSTQVGTTRKPSVTNLASYTKRKSSIVAEKRPDAKQGNAVFESSIGAYSNLNGNDGESSIINQSIDGSEAGRNERRFGENRRMRVNQSHEYGLKLKNDNAIDALSNIQFLMKEGDLRKRKHEQSPVQIQRRNNNITDRMNLQRDSMRTSNTSGLNALKKNGSKYALVRSSMFNKNPIFDKMDVQMMNINDADSEKMSISLKSQIQKPRMGRDYFSVIGHPNAAITDETDRQSSKTLNARSMSTKKFKPINYMKPSWKDDKNTLRAQSLQFNRGLSYVMIKGKVQPSEKYIYKSMMPYTNAQQFQSVQIKSSKDRHQLVLQQVQVETEQDNKSTRFAGGNKIPKSKKQKQLKGSKAASLKQVAKKLGAGASVSQTTRRKTVIMEQDEEYSDDDVRDNNPKSPKHQLATWQDLQEENNQMKESILSQIAIFEQYLKVAILQHKARERADKEEAKKSGTRHNSAENQIFKSAQDFEFENAQQKQKFLKQTQKRNQTIPKTKGQTLIKPTKKVGQLPMKQLKGQNQRVHQSAMKIMGNGQYSSQQNLSLSNRQSPVRASMQERHTRNARRFSKNSRKSSVDDLESDVDGRSESPTKVKFIISKKITTFSKMKALEHLMPESGEAQVTNNAAHIAHQTWILKIQTLWRRLNRRRNQDIVQIQNEVKKNKRQIAELTRDNMFELDVNFQDQKIFLQAKTKNSTLNRRLKYGTERKQVLEIQTRIRDEIARKTDFDTWGFHNHIIEYRLKVRMTEDIIDCAQRLQVKADAKTQRELDLLKMLRDRTYDDLKYFVDEREKKPWRVWDRAGYYFKPPVENLGLNLRQLKDRIEIHMQMIAYVEPRYAQLIRDIPPYNAINSEMIQFCTEMFGNEGWLQMFQIRQLRKQQEDEQHDKQYMPPVDQIKKLEVDPYTLQVESDNEEEMVQGQDDNDDHFESQKSQQDITDKTDKKPQQSWWVRKPDKQNQGKLKTGYEQIIASRRQPGIQTEMSIRHQEREDSDDSMEGDDFMRGHKGSQRIVTDKRYSEVIINQQDDIYSNAVMSEEVGVSGFGVNKFEGDVVQHIKNKVGEYEVQEKIQEEVKAIKKSSWLQVLEKERAAKAEREANERKQRAARLAILFEEEDVLSQDDEDLLDAGAAGQDVQDYIEKIDTHLQVEKKLLEAWHDNDEIEGGPKQ